MFAGIASSNAEALDHCYLALLVAVLGTTISPYLFFWQSGYRVESMRDERVGGARIKPLLRRSDAHATWKPGASRMDVFSGMVLSNVVMFAIITVTAVTLGARGSRGITSAAQAASALKPVAGSLATTLCALGFIGSGMLAVPVLAGSASLGISGLLGRQWGFSRSLRKAPLFFALVAAGTVGGTVLTLTPVNPITLLVFVALVNGLAAAPFLIIVMLISRRGDLMGKYRNGPLAASLGWLTVGVMAAAAIATIATSAAGQRAHVAACDVCSPG